MLDIRYHEKGRIVYERSLTRNIYIYGLVTLTVLVICKCFTHARVTKEDTMFYTI